jgi:BMFP domain-containing protein YqiC
MEQFLCQETFLRENSILMTPNPRRAGNDAPTWKHNGAPCTIAVQLRGGGFCGTVRLAGAVANSPGRRRAGFLETNMNTGKFDEIVSAVLRLLPEGPKDLEKNLRAALAGVFDRLDLVTREELEVQEAISARTRERLQELEKRLAELEEKLKRP